MPFVQLEDIKLFFEIYGSELALNKESIKSKPTMVVLHGGPGITDHTMYVEFWAQFSSIAQVIFINQRGNGRSEKGSIEKWTLTQCGRDIQNFCSYLSINKPILAGVSWGGYVALSYASLYPEDLGGLILCNTEAKVLPELRQREFFKKGGEKAADASRRLDFQLDDKANADYATYCLPLFAKHPYTSNEITRTIKNFPMREKFLKEENLSFNYTSSLTKVNCPVLILAGKDDPAHPHEGATEMANAFPNGVVSLNIIENAGAPVYKDQPEIAYKLIYQFLLNFTYNI